MLARTRPWQRRRSAVAPGSQCSGPHCGAVQTTVEGNCKPGEECCDGGPVPRLAAGAEGDRHAAAPHLLSTTIQHRLIPVTSLTLDGVLGILRTIRSILWVTVATAVVRSCSTTPAMMETHSFGPYCRPSTAREANISCTHQLCSIQVIFISESLCK